jgi:hypothetical protein
MLRVIVAIALAFAVGVSILTAVGLVLVATGSGRLRDGGVLDLIGIWLVTTAGLLAIGRLAHLAIGRIVETSRPKR